MLPKPSIIAIVFALLLVAVSVVLILVLIVFKNKNNENQTSTTPSAQPTFVPTIYPLLPIPDFKYSYAATTDTTLPFSCINFNSVINRGISMQSQGNTQANVRFWKLDVNNKPQIDTSVSLIPNVVFYVSPQSQAYVFESNGFTYGMLSGYTNATDKIGVVQLFEYLPSQNNWIVKSSMTRPFDSRQNDNFGSQISLQTIESQLVLAVSSSLAPISNNGSVYIFKFVNSSWLFNNQIIEISNEPLFGSYLSGQNNALIISARGSRIYYYEWLQDQFILEQDIFGADLGILTPDMQLIAANSTQLLMLAQSNNKFEIVQTTEIKGTINTLQSSTGIQYVISALDNKQTIIFNRESNCVCIKNQQILSNLDLVPPALNCQCTLIGSCTCQNPSNSCLVMYENVAYILAIDSLDINEVKVFEMNF